MMLRRMRGFLLGTLRGRLILGVAAVHAVMMAIFVIDLTLRQRAMLLEHQAVDATALAQSLATSAAGWIKADDISGLQELVETQRRYPELLFAMLVDEDGRILAHTDPSKQGLYLHDLPGDVRQAMLSRTPALVDVAAPALLGAEHVGWARVGIGQKKVGKKLAEITFMGILYAAAAIVIGSLIAWRMGRLITRRLYAVQDTINKVRTGNRTARSLIAGGDEAASIAAEFNAMLDMLDEQDSALIKSETKYRRRLRNIQAAVVVHGPDTRILMSNPMAQELLGLSEEQLQGKAAIDPAWHFLREDGSTLPLAEYPVTRTLASKRSIKDLIVGVRRPDQDLTTWVLANTEPTRNEQGEIDEVIVTFVDITKRKQAEVELTRVNRALRMLSDTNHALIRITDEAVLLNEICRIVVEMGNYRLAWIAFAEQDEAKTLRPMAHAGFESGYIEAAKLTWADNERGRGPGGTAIRTGKPCLVHNIHTNPSFAPWREDALRRGYQAVIALPLISEGRTFGALGVYSDETVAFDDREVEILNELAGDLAFGITALRTQAERKRAEQRLEGQHALLTAILNSSRDIIIFSLDRNYCYTTFNEKHREEMKKVWDADIKIGMNLLECMKIPELRELAKQSIDRALKGERFTEVQHQPGQDIYYEFIWSPVVQQGTIVGATVLILDITVRKRAEEAFYKSQEELHKRESELNEAQRLAHIGSWDWDAANDTIWWSDEYYRIYGFDPNKPPPNYLEHLKAYTPESAARLDVVVQRAMATGEPYAVDLELAQPTPDTRWIVARGEAKRDPDGKIRGLRGTAQNITDRKLAEQEIKRAKEELEQRVNERTAELSKKSAQLLDIRQALLNLVDDLNTKTEELKHANTKLKELDRLKSMFIASMSHELRTPLNSIIGFSSILVDEWLGPLNEEQKKNLETVARAGKHLLSLINDVIDVSKIEAGKFEISIDDFNLADVLAETKELFAKEIWDKGLEFVFESLPLQMRTDRRRLCQCLINLLSNAVKFTDWGTIRMTARLIPQELINGRAACDLVEIAVADTGIGIKEEDIPKLFGAFVRLLPPAHMSIKGTGLGLYLTRKIVQEVLEGEIKVESFFGKGSCFTIRIPARWAERRKHEEGAGD